MDEVVKILEVRAPELDINSPNAARMYDYHLGGAANFAVDRAAIDEILEWLPEGSYYAQCNRVFLARAVRYLVHEAGVDQFLDLGSGVPTAGNVHEIAQELMAAYRKATASGSYAVVSHISRISWSEEQMDRLMEIMRRTPTPERERGPEEIATLLPGYTLVPPGVVPALRWRPDRVPSDEEVARSNCYGAVGLRL